MASAEDRVDGRLVAFSRAVDVLCLAREQIAHRLGVDVATLDRYVLGASSAPAAVELALVDLLKAHESQLAAAAAALYEEAMLRLTEEGDRGATSPERSAAAAPPVPPPSPPSSAGSA